MDTVGKLPEVRLQPGVRIGGQAALQRLLTKEMQVVFLEPTFQKGAGIDAWGRMALDVDQVRTMLGLGTAEEMIEAHVVEGGRGGETGDMAAEIGLVAVGLDHHGQRIPADQRADAPFDGGVSWAFFLLGRRNGIHIGGGGGEGNMGACASRLVHQALQQEMGAFRPFPLQDSLQGIEPFAGFLGVAVFTHRTTMVAGLRIQRCRFTGHTILLEPCLSSRQIACNLPAPCATVCDR